MNPWAINPVWQNFSSLIREATTSLEARTEMDRSHHLTASLYFGIAALEAFFNRLMRNHLSAANSEQEICEVLRKGHFVDKLKKWPTEILGKPLLLTDQTLNLIKLVNEIRGDLTHPKTRGHDVYEKLEGVDPKSVIDSVADCIVRFHDAQGTMYPYWLFGWNYLNPRKDSCEIVIITDQQFCFSLQALGFHAPVPAYRRIETWPNHFLRGIDRYMAVKHALAAVDHCEPAFSEFPFRPRLCRRWWTVEHQRSCGRVIEGDSIGPRNHGA